jgi:hypothetical protein
MVDLHGISKENIMGRHGRGQQERRKKRNPLARNGKRDLEFRPFPYLAFQGDRRAVLMKD